jgi:hypothetical protein
MPGTNETPLIVYAIDRVAKRAPTPTFENCPTEFFLPGV